MFVSKHNLVWSAHFEEIASLSKVTVVDPLYNGLNFRSLNDLEKLKFNSYSEHVSAWIVLLGHKMP